MREITKEERKKFIENQEEHCRDVNAPFLCVNQVYVIRASKILYLN